MYVRCALMSGLLGATLMAMHFAAGTAPAVPAALHAMPMALVNSAFLGALPEIHYTINSGSSANRKQRLWKIPGIQQQRGEAWF